MYYVRVEMEHKTPGFVWWNPGYGFCGLSWLSTWLIYWMDATIPESIYRSSLDGCIHASDLDYGILYYGWLHPYHISCIWDISCTCLRNFFDGSVFSWTRSHKAFHPSLSLGPHALGGICYTIICHRPCNPPSRTLEGLFRDLWAVTWPKTTFMASPLTRTIIPLKIVSCEKP